MKRLPMLIFIMSIVFSISNAHILSHLTQDHYTIQNSHSSTGRSIYNLAQGIVESTSANGAVKRYAHVHMARKAPDNATQLFGTITITAHNELAGTWYLYR